MQTQLFAPFARARGEPSFKSGLAILLFLVADPFLTAIVSAQPASLDTSFDVGPASISSISAIGIQSNGRILIGGSFTSVNGYVRNGIARLNADGSLDTNFSPSSGVAGGFSVAVGSLAVQTNGQVIIGGTFSSVNGVGRSGIALLNSDGSFDTNFNSGTGIGYGYTVYAVSVQPNGQPIIAGNFFDVNGVPRYGVARLNNDGSVDKSFDPGSGTGS